MSEVVWVLALVALGSFLVIRNRFVVARTKAHLESTRVELPLLSDEVKATVTSTSESLVEGASSAPFLGVSTPFESTTTQQGARLACPPQRYDIPPSEGDYVFGDFEPHGGEHARRALTASPREYWRPAMRAHGHVMRAAGVVEATFVHGTFVGTDPFSMLRALHGLSPRLFHALELPIGAAVKRAGDFVARDAGNFDRRWIHLFQGAVEIPSSLFVWSSENTHAARLLGAVRLAEHLNDKLKALSLSTRPARVLLVGHSHAAQVFALLLQLIHEVSHAETLVRVASVLGEDIDTLLYRIEYLRRFELDVVTLGAPVRYGWPIKAQPRLLHIINHRGDSPDGGRFDGLMSTRDGDYLQQFGVAGSDLPALTAELRTLNAELDLVLGPGCAPQKWIENLRHRRRVHQGGCTYLVDYKDASSMGLPNCLATNFGHAIYTRRHAMEFLVSLICQRFYLEDV